MQPLFGSDLLQVWERGRGQHPIDQALTILQIGYPACSREDLATLSLGQRDAMLLSLKERTFGMKMKSVSDCPHCHESLELTLSTTEIRVEGGHESAALERELAIQDYCVKSRLLNSHDLAAVVGCGDADQARTLLVQRCVLSATREGSPVSPETLPEEIVKQLAEQVSAGDPQAEVLLNLTCPACAYQWQALFDIGAYLWAEVEAYAKRLLREVAMLARAYGWREADILAMSSTRRALYLSMVT